MRDLLINFCIGLLFTGCSQATRIAKICAPTAIVATVEASTDTLLIALDKGIAPEDAAQTIISRGGFPLLLCIVQHLLDDPAGEVAGPVQGHRCKHRPVRKVHRQALLKLRTYALERL